MTARGLLERGDRTGALRELLLSLRGWPTTAWAADAAASAALALAEEKRANDACMMLGELERRYPQRPPGVMQQADHARRLAGGCGT